MLEISAPLIAPLLAFFGFLALMLRHLMLPAPGSRALAATQPADPVHIFDFADGQLVGASENAIRAINRTGLSEGAYDHLMERLGRLFPDVKSCVSQALETCQSVTLSKVTEGGVIDVCIEPRLPGPRIKITGMAAPFANFKLVDLTRHDRQMADLATLREMADISPVPAWRETSRGEIDWVNKAYQDLVKGSELEGDGTETPPVRLFQSAQIRKPGTPRTPRRSALNMRDGTARVYETVSLALGDHSVHFGIDASATALAEDNLRDFTQTLTQTFAELPIGLAIFDSSRRLVMFNPALLELTSLKPVWLTAKPTLYDFLNELREQRMAPERKDFRGWRDELVALERSAEKGTYLETWSLPSGQIYRVIGRPHPQGAIAFFFEDITSEIALTRKIRSEKKLQDDMLDAISEAVIAFDGQGKLTATNERFADLWGTNPCQSANLQHIHDIAKLWQSKCHPSPIWGDLRDFVFQRSERAEWTGTIIHRDGRSLTARVTPLSGNVTMVSFSDMAVETPMVPKRDVKISSLTA